MPSGGRRAGAGRPKGTKNLRTVAATELVYEAQEKFPDFNPIAALIALAAEPETDPALAKDCYVAVLPYMAPKFRPVEADIDRLVEIEARLVKVKLEAQSEVLHSNPGLAERLARAKQQVFVVTGISRAPDEPIPDPIEGLSERLSNARATAERLAPPEDAPPAASLAPAGPARAPERAAVPLAPPEPYRPLMPERPPLRFSQTMDPDYRPFED